MLVNDFVDFGRAPARQLRLWLECCGSLWQSIRLARICSILAGGMAAAIAADQDIVKNPRSASSREMPQLKFLRSFYQPLAWHIWTATRSCMSRTRRSENASSPDLLGRVTLWSTWDMWHIYWHNIDTYWIILTHIESYWHWFHSLHSALNALLLPRRNAWRIWWKMRRYNNDTYSNTLHSNHIVILDVVKAWGPPTASLECMRMRWFFPKSRSWAIYNII